MRLYSFDPFRTLGFPGVRGLKPGEMFLRRDELRVADAVLFPEAWQLNALVHGLGCRVFPSVASYRIGVDKVEMSRAFAMVAPEHVPDTFIGLNEPATRAEIWDRMVLPFVAKVPKAARGDGVFLIGSAADWARYAEVTDVLYAQEYLPIDRDLRVVVVGRDVLPAYWRRQSPRGFHNNVAKGGTIVRDAVPPAALDLVRRVAGALDIDHAGFDVAVVGGHPYLLEFNRLFGNAGVDDAALRGAILAWLAVRLGPVDPVASEAPHAPRPPARPLLPAA